MLLFISLLLFWFVMGGQVTAEISIVGLFIVGAIWYFFNKNKHQTNQGKLSFKLILSSLSFLGLVLVEIIKANIDMIDIVLTPGNEDMDPAFAKFNPGLKTDLGKTALAHAITLTPGTITVATDGDDFIVTGMNMDMVRGIEESDFVKALQKIEKLQG